tara:strand:+ start:3088 stop:3645 length:558 start_codon:yes stop_codon:yes gene_type:complete
MNECVNLQRHRFWRNGAQVFFLLFLSLPLTSIFSDTTNGKNLEDDPCFSADQQLGDSAFWAVTAVNLYNEKEYSKAVAVVDACFGKWGPDAGHQQKKLLDEKVKCPPIGRVNRQDRLSIDRDYLMNDVSFALWVKARSLDELGKIEMAKIAYAQCLYMTCGRVWDVNGWFWSPAEDCIKYARKLL